MGLGVVVTAWAAMDRSQTSNTNNMKIWRVGPYSWMGLGDSRKVRRVGPYYPACFLELGGGSWKSLIMEADRKCVLDSHGPRPDFKQKHQENKEGGPYSWTGLGDSRKARRVTSFFMDGTGCGGHSLDRQGP